MKFSSLRMGVSLFLCCGGERAEHESYKYLSFDIGTVFWLSSAGLQPAKRL